jgi:hypothetical protein
MKLASKWGKFSWGTMEISEYGRSSLKVFETDDRPTTRHIIGGYIASQH